MAPQRKMFFLGLLLLALLQSQGHARHTLQSPGTWSGSKRPTLQALGEGAVPHTQHNLQTVLDAQEERHMVKDERQEAHTHERQLRQHAAQPLPPSAKAIPTTKGSSPPVKASSRAQAPAKPPPTRKPIPSPSGKQSLAMSPPKPTQPKAKPPPPSKGPSAQEAGGAVKPTAGRTTSKLWGLDGELWTPQGRLTDFSYAGYMQGEAAIPTPPVTRDLKLHYDAVGDGITDDSDAFERALNGTPSGGVLYIPAGTYKISRASRVFGKPLIIRGAGRDKTILYYTRSFREIDPDTYTKDPSAFSSAWFMLTFQGQYPLVYWRDSIANITAPAARGDRVIRVTSTSQMTAGQWIRVVTSDLNGSAVQYLYGDVPVMEDYDELVNRTNLLRLRTPIKRIINETALELVRPLHFDLRANYTASAVFKAWSAMENMGIENLTVRFKPSNYSGHLKEDGFNWLMLRDATNCWVRNIRIRNADYGLVLYTSDSCTVENMIFDTDYDRAAWNPKITKGLTGHHAIAAAYGQDYLIRNFEVRTTMVHDITFFTFTHSSVVKNGSGVDLSIDMHRSAPHNNLLTNLNCGACTRLWVSGGPGDYGGHAGLLNTYWNLNISSAAKMPRCLPDPSFGPKINFVGLPCNDSIPPTKAPLGPYGWYKEDVAGPGQPMYPLDLHAAMFQKRMSSKGLYP